MTTLDASRPRVLRNESEYDAAVAEMNALLDRGTVPGSDDEDRLQLLTLLVADYDQRSFPMGEMSSPQSVVDFMLEQQGMTRADLAELMGGRSRVSDFFAGKRGLSLNQIRKLGRELGIPADLLLGEDFEEEESPAEPRQTYGFAPGRRSDPTSRSGRGRSMSRDVHTVKNQDGSGWVNKVGGKIESKHRTQEAAIERGRNIAKANQAEHVIHGRDGKIRDKNSYGNDPNPPKGKR